MSFDPVDKWLEYFAASDETELRDELGLDIREVRPVYIGKNAEIGLDLWGNKFGSVGGAGGAGYSSTRNHHFLSNINSFSDINKFEWPSPDNFDFEVVTVALKSLPDDKAKLIRMAYAADTPGQNRKEASRAPRAGGWLPLLCTLFDIFGMEETLVNLHTNPKWIEAIIDHLEELLLGIEERLLEASRGSAEIFCFGDDFATQRGLLISPDHWRRFLKPTYSKIYSLAKKYGLKVWIHSCGSFRDVLPDMIDIGMDVWETTQVHLQGNNPEEIKHEYGQHIAFFGAISTQHTLPYGSPDAVRNEVRERIEILGRGGGYICGGDHTILDDVPISNIIALVDEAKRFRFSE